MFNVGDKVIIKDNESNKKDKWLSQRLKCVVTVKEVVNSQFISLQENPENFQYSDNRFQYASYDINGVRFVSSYYTEDDMHFIVYADAVDHVRKIRLQKQLFHIVSDPYYPLDGYVLAEKLIKNKDKILEILKSL